MNSVKLCRANQTPARWFKTRLQLYWNYKRYKKNKRKIVKCSLLEKQRKHIWYQCHYEKSHQIQGKKNEKKSSKKFIYDNIKLSVFYIMIAKIHFYNFKPPTNSLFCVVCNIHVVLHLCF